MKIDGPLIKAEFVSRPNRFITFVKIGDTVVKSHLPDPGRLKELLVPGADLRVRRADGDTDRKTMYTTVMVRSHGILVSLVSSLPNKFIKEAINEKEIPFLSEYTLIKTEITYENHRFDFLLEDRNNNEVYLEVKSVTHVIDGIGRFPDAVTARGASHLRKLTEICNGGGKAAVLFVCQRSDIERFEPMWDVDPTFSLVLKKAYESGVKVWCISTNVTENDMTFYKEIPVYLGPL